MVPNSGVHNNKWTVEEEKNYVDGLGGHRKDKNYKVPDWVKIKYLERYIFTADLREQDEITTAGKAHAFKLLERLRRKQSD